MRKIYEFPVPVFKQGDDLAQFIEQNENHRDALFALAEQYEVAADVCRAVARRAGDDFKIECADAHFILIEDDEENMEPLVKGELIFIPEDDGEEFICDECKAKADKELN